MAQTLTSQQLVVVARALTRFQSSFTDYELANYDQLSPAERQQVETGLAAIASCAGRLYAYSVRLAFAEAQPQLDQLTAAAQDLEQFLHTVATIQKVLDAVTLVATLATAILSHDIAGITDGINDVAGMFQKT